MAVMVLLYAAARFGIRVGPAHVEYREDAPALMFTRLIGDVTLLLLLVALFQLTRMLGRIAAGELFSAVVVSRFRSFAFWLLLMALFSLLAPPAAQLLQQSPGGHRLQLIIDFREVLTVGVTLVLFLLARLLERARAIDEEIREFV
ncbi:MAG: DUF2975 domain-containing protein [Sphingomicrobium sp.]